MNQVLIRMLALAACASTLASCGDNNDSAPSFGNIESIYALASGCYMISPNASGDYLSAVSAQNATVTANSAEADRILFRASDLGEFLIREMMKRGMILEIDHLPRKGYVRAFEMMREYDYPAAGTHGRNNNGKLYELGGISTTGFGRCRSADTPATMDDRFQDRITLARDMGAYPAEGFGFDLNGFAGAPGPRFGDRANCGDPQTDEGITYPFTSYAGDVTLEQPVVGTRSLDFNTEGMVHLGLVAEYIEDVRRDGASDEDLEPLFRSAEGYLRMWEKAEQRGTALSP